MSKARLKSLYLRLGGEDGLKTVLYDFYDRMSQDILIGYFFSGKDPNAIADLQLQFLLHAMGVQPVYSGKLPAQAHEKLPPILAGHFDRRLVLLRQTLLDHGLNEREIKTWVEFESAFRGVIVKHEKP